MTSDVLERLRAANPVPTDPPAPPLEALAPRLGEMPKSWTSMQRRWRRPTRRGLVVGLVGLSITVPALAATTPWEPIFGHPSRGDVPEGVSSSAVPESEVALLGVLRRPQSESDRGTAARGLLRSVGQEYQGVRPASIRLLTSSGGQHALLVSTQGYGKAASPGVFELGDNLCLEYGHGSICGDAEKLRSGLFLAAFDDNVVGLVPDGVTRVELHFASGVTIAAVVRDNLFWASGVPTALRSYRVLNPPPGVPSVMKHRETERPTPAWFDAHGRLIGP